MPEVTEETLLVISIPTLGEIPNNLLTALSIQSKGNFTTPGVCLFLLKPEILFWMFSTWQSVPHATLGMQEG